MTEEIKSKYFAETAIALRREGFQVEQLQDGHLNVMMDDQPLCEVYKIGGIIYRDVSTPERTAAKDRTFGIVSTTAEYIRGMELAPPLGIKDLKDRYKVLADFNGTVLACTHGEFGVEFVTWDWDFDRDGVSHGHYFGGDYRGAKQDFVTRSGLIPEQHVFTDDQLIEIYRCCADTLDAGIYLTNEQAECICSVQNQIKSGIPNIMERQNELAPHKEPDRHTMRSYGQGPTM